MNNIINRLLTQLSLFNEAQLTEVKQNLLIILNDYDIKAKTTDIVPINNDIRTKAIQMFFVSKKVEGCTEKTLEYYRHVIKFFFSDITKPLKEITTDDVRYYIAKRAMQDKISKTSQDNELRVLKSFFNWCAGEDYINKVPTLNIKPIKHQKKIKKPFTEIEMERLRKNTDNVRDLAIIDVLFSTGVRVSELCQINILDIQNDELLVFGKGEKERIVYLNAKAKLSLLEYLSNRKDDNPALFVSLKSPHKRLTAGGVEGIVRKLGSKSGVPNAHPHRFRRTAATLALNRGMPIEQVAQMLGHNKIETTTIYARSEQENVKASHRKYVV